MTPPVSSFITVMAAFTARHTLLPENASVLIALSGGPDSCALLLAFERAMRAGYLPGRLVGAAHFHHGLRGVDADADAAFSAALAARLGLPCLVGLGHAVAARGQSPNQAARDARYEFLRESARELGANLIATAHTADDQTETILLRVLRGTGIEGLAGIPVRRDLGAGLAVIRPILGQSRADVEAFCAECGIIPRRDPSNEKDRYARSRLRRRLPEIARDFNPRLNDSIARLAASASADADLIGALADSLWEQTACVSSSDIFTLTVAPLSAAHQALRRRVLLRAIRHATTGTGGVEEAGTAQFVSILEEIIRFGRGAVDLPGGVTARLTENTLSLARAGAVLAAPVLSYSISLPLPGLASIPGIDLQITARRLVSGEAPIRQRRGMAVDIAAEAVRDTIGDDSGPALIVRAARPGDRMGPLGMGGRTRLLRDMMAEAKWPPQRRETAPVVVHPMSGAILWTIGLAQSEATRVGPDVSEIWRLSAENKD